MLARDPGGAFALDQARPREWFSPRPAARCLSPGGSSATDRRRWSRWTPGEIPSLCAVDGEIRGA